MPPISSEIADLALILKNSNIEEVSKLANGYLELEAAYGKLRQTVVQQASELVMRRHESVFKRLAEAEKKEKDERSDDSEG